jgi:hypothetical protein
MLGHCLHGLCTLPNMVSNANMVRKSEKNREKGINLMYTIVDDFGAVFAWSVHISKYGK